MQIKLHEFYPNEFSDTTSTYPSRSWRPRLTPYRILMLSSTIGLGSAKAYATSRDSALVATTVEWIAGVVLFSIFFILGLLESNPPRRLSYFFEHDLGLLFRPFFGCRYFTDENEPQHSTNKNIYPQMLHPPITGYRLLTSISVASFGLVKAGLVYQDFSQDANAVDWISGVLLTSCLYVLGLYEDNPVGLMPYMFSFDFAPLLLSGSLVTCHLFGLLLSCLWIGYWVKNVFTPFPDIRAVYNGIDKEYIPVHPSPTTTFQGIHNLTQFIFHIFGSLLIPFMGVICFFVIFLNLYEYFGGFESPKWAKATYNAIRRIILSSLPAVFRVVRTMRLVSWIKRPSLKLLLLFQRFALHILVYTFGALLTGIATFNIMGILSVLWFEVDRPSLFTYLFATYFTILGGIPLFMVGYLCGYCLVLLVAPFRVDWQAPGYERTFFELG